MPRVRCGPRRSPATLDTTAARIELTLPSCPVVPTRPRRFAVRPSARVAFFVSLALVLVSGIALATSAVAAGPPAFVQQVTAHKLNVASLAVTPAAATTAGDRLVVEVGIWGPGSPTISAV